MCQRSSTLCRHRVKFFPGSSKCMRYCYTGRTVSYRTSAWAGAVFGGFCYVDNYDTCTLLPAGVVYGLEDTVIIVNGKFSFAKNVAKQDGGKGPLGTRVAVASRKRRHLKLVVSCFVLYCCNVSCVQTPWKYPIGDE